MRLTPHALALLAGSAVAVTGCGGVSSLASSGEQTTAQGSNDQAQNDQAQNDQAQNDQAQNEQAQSDTIAVSNSDPQDATATDGQTTSTSSEPIAPEDYPPPCGRG